MTVALFLQVLACVLLFCAAAGWPTIARPHFGWAGMFCWLLSLVLVGVG